MSFAVRLQGTRVTQAPAAQPPVRDPARSSASEVLRGNDPLTDGRRILRVRPADQRGRCDPRHRQPEIDPIPERPGDPALVPLRSEQRAGAGTIARSGEPARARVHRCDELETGREGRRPSHPGDRDPALLERLPKRFEDIAIELGQLIEEQDTFMGERDLAGGQAWTTTDHRRVGERVVRGPVRWLAVQSLDRSFARCRRDDRRSQSGSIAERGQEPRDRPRQQRLAGSRRADQHQSMPARERDLQPTPSLELTANLRQVRGVPTICG